MLFCYSSRKRLSQLLCRQRTVIIITALSVFQSSFRQLQAHLNLYDFPTSVQEAASCVPCCVPFGFPLDAAQSCRPPGAAAQTGAFAASLAQWPPARAPPQGLPPAALGCPAWAGPTHRLSRRACWFELK